MDAQPPIVALDFDSYRGVDEMNWADFPLFSPTKYGDRTEQTLTTVFVTENKNQPGEQITRVQEIVASQKYGLPTDNDGDVLMGLLALLLSKDKPYRIRGTRIYFSRRQFFRYIKWSNNGEKYTRFKESLHRWTATSFHYENWWNDISQKYCPMAFNVLVSFRGYNSAFDDPEDDNWFVEFTADFIKAFDGGWLKPIDLAFYFSLRNPTAKALFRILDKRGRPGQRRKFDLRTLATQHLGLKGVDAKGKPLAISVLRQRLEPAIKELVQKGFIEDCPKSERFGRVSSREQDVYFIRTDGIVPQQIEQQNELFVEMVALGCWEDEASKFIANPTYSEAYLRERVEWVKWLIEEPSKKTPDSPGALLADLVKHPKKTPPPEFETTTQRQARLDKARADKIAKAKAEALAKEKEKKEREESDAKYAAEMAAMTQYRNELTELERHAFDDEVIALVAPMHRKYARQYLKSGERGIGEALYKNAAVKVLARVKE